MSNGRPIIQQQMKININLAELETKLCPHCASFIFTVGQCMLKELPIMQSPSGKPQLIRIDLVACADCGTLFQIQNDELHAVNLDLDPDL